MGQIRRSQDGDFVTVVGAIAFHVPSLPPPGESVPGPD